MKIDENEKDAILFLVGCTSIALLLLAAICVISWIITKNLT